MANRPVILSDARLPDVEELVLPCRDLSEHDGACLRPSRILRAVRLSKDETT